MPHLKAIEKGTESYLNDILLDLPEGGKPFTVTVNDIEFVLHPEHAKDYCMNYGRDNYNQCVESLGDDIESFYSFIYHTGDIVDF